MDKVLIEDLLEKNQEAKKVFEENAKKLGSRRGNAGRGKGYGLALPYDGVRLRQGDQTDDASPPAASYQKF